MSKRTSRYESGLVKDPNWEFRFYDENGNLHWKGNLLKARCGALKNGTRCNKYTTRIHPHCFECTINKYKVAIGSSSQGEGAGLGLFAYDRYKGAGEIVFREGDFIAPYAGEVISDEDSEERYTGASKIDGDLVCCPYSIENFKGETVDASLIRGPGAFCNDSLEKDYNAELAEDEDEEFIFIHALKDIKQHEEILVSYGDDYWNSKHFKFETVRVTPKRKSK